MQHHERHFLGGATVRDVVLGMADGLTVPFALAAGLSGALAKSHLVVTAGLAEVAAGSIAMGLGGYLAARGDAEHYATELERERREIRDVREHEEAEVVEVFAAYGLTREQVMPVIEAFRERPEQWAEFMMRFELGLDKPDASRAWKSALIIGGSYVLGGLFPLVPYMLLSDTHRALMFSGAATLVALAIFGWVKAAFSGGSRPRSALQTALIGGVAACAAFLLARAVA